MTLFERWLHTIDGYDAVQGLTDVGVSEDSAKLALEVAYLAGRADQAEKMEAELLGVKRG